MASQLKCRVVIDFGMWWMPSQRELLKVWYPKWRKEIKRMLKGTVESAVVDAVAVDRFQVLAMKFSIPKAKK